MAPDHGEADAAEGGCSLTLDPTLTTRRARVLALREAGGATLEQVIEAWEVDGGEARVLLAAAGPGPLPVLPAPRPASLLRTLLADYLRIPLSPLQSMLVDLAGSGIWPETVTEAHRAATDDDQAEIDAATEVRRADVGGGSVRYRARRGVGTRSRPDSVCVVAGVRGGKTTIAACALVACALEADLSSLRAGEVAYGVIVAPTLDAADKTFEDLCHLVRETPLAKRLVGEPANRRLTIQRDDKRHVTMRVVAASKGGLTSRSRWLVGCVLEEAAYFGSEGAGAAVSAEDQYAAVADRIVPGGQVWMISSPNGPEGLLYETWRRVPEGWAVVHAPTRALNPSYPQERVDRAMRRDPDRARRELGAEFLDGETALIPGEWIERATVPCASPVPSSRRVAAMDPATRGNGWTLVVADRTATGVAVVAAREWRGSKASPLSPSETLQAIAGELRRWGVSTVITDRHHVDSLRDLARPWGLMLTERTTSSAAGMEQAQRVRGLLGDGTLTLCDVPEMARDLRAAKKILTRHGSALLLPHTPDGRHADYFPSVSLAVWELRGAAAPVTVVDDDEYAHGRPLSLRRGAADRAAPWRLGRVLTLGRSGREHVNVCFRRPDPDVVSSHRHRDLPA